MPVHVFKSTGKELFRVFYYSQVHGTEDETRMACFLLIDDIKLNPGGYYDNVSIAIMPTVNVDGFAHDPPTYATPFGWDCDIDAMARFTPEARNVFNFVKTWKPQVTVDGHNLNRYFASTNYALQRNLARSDDFVVFKLETQTPRKDITHKQYIDMFKELRTLYPQYLFSEFWTINDVAPSYDGSRSRAQYYTDDPALIYQFMAQRYNTIGFLSEGISPFDLTDPDEYAIREEIARRSNYLFLKYLVDYFKKRTHLVSPKVCILEQGTEIPVNWTPRLELAQFQTFNVEDRDSGAPRHYVSDEYQIYYDPIRWVTIPLGYSYPNTEAFGELTYYLNTQYDYDLFVGSASNIYDIETIHIISSDPGTRFENVHKAWQDGPKNVSAVNVDSRMTDFSNMVIVPCNQEGGHFLCQLLEPYSKYALTRYYEEINLELIDDSDYPIKRLITRIA